MAPFPPFLLRSGASTPSQEAGFVYMYYLSIAKLSHELNVETEVDVFKLAKLAFASCRTFFLKTANPPADLLVAVRQCFESEGLTWATQGAMASDLAALRTQAQAFFVFVRDNVPAARTIATRTYDDAGTETEQSATIPKTQAIADQVAALRAIFV